MRSTRFTSKLCRLVFISLFACLSMIGCGGGGRQSASGSPGPSPAPIPTATPNSAVLTATPSSLGFGSEIVNTPATLTVKISNTGGASATITQNSISGSGFSTGITTPITLNPAQSVNVPVVFSPSAAGAASGSLTLSSNGTAMISVPLSGMGLMPQAHSVDIAWNASTSSSLEGYNVYRSGTSGGPYARISPLLSATTLLYTDITPLSGQKYFYVVTAVDVGGAESAASTEVVVTIPTP